MSEQFEVKGLDRYLSTLDVWAMAFGCMIGWGAFVMPGTTFLPIAGPAGTTISMVIGALFMLVIGANMSWLMQRNTGTGGIYSYTKEAFGRDHAFLCSWFLCLSYLTVVFLNGSALFLVMRTLLGHSIQSGLSYMVAGNEIYLREVGTSVAALACVGVLFIGAKPFLQRLQTILSIILFAGVLVSSIVCLPHVLASDAALSFGTLGVNKNFAVFSLIILAPWAFVGFEITSFETAHFKFDIKSITCILFASILMAGFAYTAMTFLSISVIPDGFGSWQEYVANLDTLSGVASVPTFYAAQATMGPVGLAVIGMTALAAIMTGIIGGYRATVRVLSTMAEDKILSEAFSKTTYSILFVMGICIPISLLGRNTLIWFVDLTSFGAIVAYGYTCAAAYRTAKPEGNKLIMAMGLIGAVISACFAVVQIVPRLAALDTMGSEAFLLLSLWCLLGFVFYWRTIHRSTLTEYTGLSISGIVLFALLVYSALMWLAQLLVRKESIEEVRQTLASGGIVVMLIVFIGMVVMLYVQDVVRKKHEEIERDKIRIAEGSLAKSQFLFNMSHDIRTPMNAIIGYTNLAREETSLDVIQTYLDKIRASSDHLLALINDILEMSRIESGRTEHEYEPIDLGLLFEQLGDLFADQMSQKGLDFSVHTTQVQDRYVWCDKKSMNRVLMNIISNAYKFTPTGGSVSVTLFEVGSPEGGYASYEMRVQDTGIGMSKDFVDKMFTAFERERSSTESGIEGTGLGLAITKSLVDLMGGTIEVSTSPGNGTRIIIRMKLKLADETELPTPESISAQDSEPDDVFADKRLLLVEDNVINMEIANMILTQKGFMVETAENGEVAVGMVSSSQPGYYDAILMDIQMPVMDGYTAARAIRSLDDEQLATIPIIAMTANAFQEDVDAALDAGMQAHVAKPVDVDVLMRELRAVL